MAAEHSIFFVVPTTDDNVSQSARSTTAQIADLLHEANLSELTQFDWLDQVQFFLHERSHHLNQVQRR